MRQRPLLSWAAAFAAGIGLEAWGVLTPLIALCLAGLGLAETGGDGADFWQGAGGKFPARF